MGKQCHKSIIFISSFFLTRFLLFPFPCLCILLPASQIDHLTTISSSSALFILAICVALAVSLVALSSLRWPPISSMTSSSLLRRGSITVINRPSFPFCCDVALSCCRCYYCCCRCGCFSSPSSASSLAALSCKIDNSIIVPWCPVFAVAVMLCHSGCCFSTTFISSHEVSISWHRKSSSSSVNHLNLLHLHRLSPLHSELLLLQRFRRAQASQRRFTACRVFLLQFR